MKRFLIIAAVIIVGLALLIGGPVLALTWGLSEGAGVQINEVDLDTLEDGIYRGQYEGGRWSNEIAVTIQGQKIVDTEIVKDLRYTREGVSEQVFEAVIRKQSVTVDTVTDATVSSKAYLKAIENALTN